VNQAAAGARSRPSLGLDARLALLALALTLVRLVAAARVHLTEDEAYYRLWSQHLALGYLDHPPMIAWWIRLGTLVCGDNPLGVRLVPVLASGFGTWLIGAVTRSLGGDARTAFRAALWYNAALTVGLGGLLALPDNPASLFWMLTLWALAWAWRRDEARWWAAAGVAAGLGTLSKYSALFLAPGVILWLACVPGGLVRLRRPGPWIAAALAGAIFALNVAWNAQNGWMTFSKQFGRVAGESLTPQHLLEFLATQALLLTPLIAWWAGRGMVRAWRGRRGPEGALALLPVATAVPFALYLALHSLHDRVQGHWPAPLFGALSICAAMAAAPQGDAPQGDRRNARWLRWLTPAIGYAVAAAALALAALPAPTPLGSKDPTLALRGWPAFARDVEQLRARTGAAWVGTESYGGYAQLAQEHAITTPLLQVIDRDRYRWVGDAQPDFTRPGLVVDIARRMKVQDVGRCFRRVTPVATLGRAGGLGHNQVYSAFLVSGPKRDVWIIGCPAEVRPGVWR
jgi:4-amino-4-deoxy-L-arabinose transferase-like glycosyltransferase